jgi:hypothetical protein
MLANRKVLIATTVMAAAVLTSAVAKEHPQAKAAIAPDVKAFPSAEAPAPKPTKKVWEVDVLPSVKGAARDAQLALAKVLDGMESVPPGRAAHFKSLNNPSFRIVGWHAFIESTTLSRSGTLVTLRISPLVTSDLGASTTVLGHVLESFEVTKGAARYVDSWEPPGGSDRGFLTD